MLRLPALHWLTTQLGLRRMQCQRHFLRLVTAACRLWSTVLPLARRLYSELRVECELLTSPFRIMVQLVVHLLLSLRLSTMATCVVERILVRELPVMQVQVFSSSTSRLLLTYWPAILVVRVSIS